MELSNSAACKSLSSCVLQVIISYQNKVNMIKIKSRLTFVVALILFSTGVFSQSENDSVPIQNNDTVQVKVPKRLNVGCGYGLNFVGGTSINISPNLTYMLTDKIILGMEYKAPIQR